MMMMMRQSSSLLQRLLLQRSQRTLSTRKTTAAAAVSSSSSSSTSLWPERCRTIRSHHPSHHRLPPCSLAAAAANVAFFSSMAISRSCYPPLLTPAVFQNCTIVSASASSLSSSSSCVGLFSVMKRRRRRRQRCGMSSSSSSSSMTRRPIRVLYASAGGTAQLFAMHLVEQLQNNNLQSSSSSSAAAAAPTTMVSLESMADYPTLESMLLKNNTNNSNSNNASPPPLYIFLLSTAGVGEPPGMAKQWYESLMKMSQDAITATTNANHQLPLSLDYAIFGLGNSLAHPHHYNSFSKNVDQKLQELNGKPFLPLALGDDGDCIEDDFDQWEALVVQTIEKNQNNSSSSTSTGQEATAAAAAAAGPAPAAAEKKEEVPPVVVAATATATITPVTPAPAATATTTATATTAAPRVRSCPGSTSPCGTRTVSVHDNKLPFLQLQAPTTEIVCLHLLDVAPSWYQKDDNNTVVTTNKCHVLEQVLLNENAAANGLRELRLQLAPHVHYQAGDHILLYPRNNDYMVEAYLRTLLKNVHPHAIIQGPAVPAADNENENDGNKKKYPHPTGITVYETLSHCVDLGATPSPSFSRLLTTTTTTGLPSSDDQQQPLNYKKDIVGAGRTTLDLALEYQKDGENTLSLEDVLYNLPPLQPRYYSIGSSHLLHPHKVFLTYRPVRYVTNRGHLREGLCTSFMVGLHGPGKQGGGAGKGSFVLGAIRNNPTFRLPADTTKSILMIAGGCGVAPIRAFLEERLELLKLSNNMNANNKQPFFGDGLLFLGFRTPQDAVYQDLIQQALDAGALTASHLSFDTGLPMNDPRRGTVTQSLGKHGLELWQHFEKGGYTYVCGGARTMGAAVERQIHEILTQYGNMTPDDATKYMRNMITEGRLCEDLAD